MTPISALETRSRMCVAGLVIVMLHVFFAGCGSDKVRKDQKKVSLATAVVGEPVRVEGVLSQRGGTPHTILILETDEGGPVMIESKTIKKELASLSGMSVAIEGEAMPSIDGEIPLVNALRYRMLRLSTGELPVVGIVGVVDTLCFLTTTEGKRYWIRGDFTGVISEFDGAKIWVIGSFGDPALPDVPEGATPYWVTGYGLLSTP